MNYHKCSPKEYPYYDIIVPALSKIKLFTLLFVKIDAQLLIEEESENIWLSFVAILQISDHSPYSSKGYPSSSSVSVITNGATLNL